MDGGSKIDKGGRDEADNDTTYNDILVPLPTQSLSHDMCDEKDAEGHWFHFWFNLVGLWTQSHCLFHCFSCKHTLSFSLLKEKKIIWVKFIQIKKKNS